MVELMDLRPGIIPTVIGRTGVIIAIALLVPGIRLMAIGAFGR